MSGEGAEGRTRFNPRFVRVDGPVEARRLLEELGADKGGIAIMNGKMQHAVVAVENVQAAAAHIIKQTMLSKGGECATPRDIFFHDGDRVKVMMMGTVTQFRRAIKNLSVQPFGLGVLSRELKEMFERAYPRSDGRRKMAAGRYTLSFGGRTLVMGVVNVTPDSFSDAGRYFSLDDARERALQMAGAGADIIDIGGESARPGAEPVSLEEEARRTIPLIESLAPEMNVPISIDTCKAELAAGALDAGASIVNDISGLRFDPGMIPLLSERGVPVVIMHMQGTPGNMQDNPTYEDVVGDIVRFLRERAGLAEEGGVAGGRIIVDPGIGFGKTVEHNLEIVRRIDELGSTGYPVLLGTSRKSFIGTVLDRPVDRRLFGTAASVAFAIARGVDAVRVHDVEELMDVVRMSDAMAGKKDTEDQPESPWIR